ncbi:MAG: M28 family peptidase [Anaerolineae bacterium]|nr:M28 family peptidase [Anaerolineae bacterium]
MKKSINLLTVIALLILAGCATGPQADHTTSAPTEPPAPTALSPADVAPPPSVETTPGAGETDPAVLPGADPFTLVSQDSLFAYLEDLTAIQPYSGWRNSGSLGEQEALDYVQERLAEFGYLQGLGLEVERQEFRVFLATELWDSQLRLTVGGREVDVPASGLRGDRDSVVQALYFDSDGELDDAERDPVVVAGPVAVIHSADEIGALTAAGLRGKVAFVDYAVVDRSVMDPQRATAIASDLLAREPAGVVLVTRNSNKIGESHGAFVGDLAAFNWAERRGDEPTPVLYARLEDLAPAGIDSLDDLAQVEAARLTWDADVSSPATSGNLAARIPGADSSQALILGAHIDSPNAPGAMDDGSGSAILLEVARILDAARFQPAVDLYLVWFGSEELGLYGSAHFVSTHQELLDRTVGMLQFDCLSHPLDGIDARLDLVGWSYGRLGDDSLAWPDFLSQAAAQRGVEVGVTDSYTPWSDNSPFAGYDVPNADLIYMNEEEMEATGSLHYGAHIHDPYDTVDLVLGDVLEEMARVALAAVVDTRGDAWSLRATPRADRRAVLIGSHTEAVHMTPAGLTDFGMALSMEGFDVDLIPYGQVVTAADLEDADLAIVLPLLDYPGPGGGPELYDEAWSADEVAALEQYVAGGGLLVLTNSANRLKYYNRVLDPNEDSADANDLSGRFGVTFEDRTLATGNVRVTGSSPLAQGSRQLAIARNNGVRFGLVEGAQFEIVAETGGQTVVALVRYGDAGGEVLVLADLSILGSSGEPTLANLPFWRNLAGYARNR